MVKHRQKYIWPQIPLFDLVVIYITTSKAVCQTIWLKIIFEDIGKPQEDPTKIYCGNTLAIAMAKNLVYHSRTKHIVTGVLSLSHRSRSRWRNQYEIYCESEEQLTDIFTNALPR